MTFRNIITEVIAWLQQDGRISYRVLKRQFDLDDADLEDLKDGLLFAYPVVDEDGRGLVWTGDHPTPKADARPSADAEHRFRTALLAVIMLLQRDQRVTYRTLKNALGINGALLTDIRQELRLRRLAIDEAGEVLVWAGETRFFPQPTKRLRHCDDIPSVACSPISSRGHGDRNEWATSFSTRCAYRAIV
jgi:hypothetical protein